jgi:hypothetical protein
VPPWLYSRASVALFPCLRGSIPVPPWLYSRALFDKAILKLFYEDRRLIK